MKNLFLEFDENSIAIKMNDKRILYSTSVKEVLIPIEFNVSNVIVHLLDKSWIEIKSLYKIAEYAHKKQSNNDIDWRCTFYAVEKHFFDDATGDMLFPYEEGTSYYKHLLNRIRYNSISDSNGIVLKIAKIVEENLLKYGL
ncbi:hypothetical protein [Spirosoma arcticum]